MSSDRPASVDASAMAESTPLIAKNGEEQEGGKPRVRIPFLKPIHSILLCGFLVSLSFSVTQVPLIYVFRVMTCDAYYSTHPHTDNNGSNSNTLTTDRCSLPEIEASTAYAVSLLGCGTTFFGVINLFITGHAIKRYGVKAALAFQVFWPAARLVVQNVGVRVGGRDGIIIMQCSQLITVVGGPVGYMLALNSYVAEVARNRERTGYLGILQGMNMFGSALGTLIGGILADVYSISTPFEVTLGLFVASMVYVLIFLPWIEARGEVEVSSKGQGVLARAFGPLKSIMPAKWVLRDGRIQTEYGTLILACGVFLGVLATGYISTVLQMYATNEFEFGTEGNSWLVSSHLFLRGTFLTLAFPRIIMAGRNFLERHSGVTTGSRRNSQIPRETIAAQGQMAEALQEEEEENVLLRIPTIEQETFEFDLIYTRFSLLVDGTITLGAAFINQGWQMYLIGAILPLGAGTASAAKGTILQMCPASERTDALSAISLVEMVARLSTTFVFGVVFAVFASVGKAYLVFVCNAAVALLGFAILLLSRFPPEGSRRLDVKVPDDGNTDGEVS